MIALLLLGAGASACHATPPPGVTSLTSVPIVSHEADASTPVVARTPGPPGADAPSLPSPVCAPSTSAPSSAEPPLVSPGLDNEANGGVANTGAPLNYPYPYPYQR